MELLKPRIDIVFKMIFVENQPALRAMLEAVLGVSIGDLQVLNPQIPGDLSTEKNIVLDLRVSLADGSRIAVEMQIRASEELAGRLTYYAARDYSKQLRRGDSYRSLTPTVVIVWLWESLFFQNLAHLHRIFQLRDANTAELLTPDLAIHVLQLQDFRTPPSAPESPAERALRRWARFLSLENETELRQLAEEDASMENAIRTLEKLSDDPEKARLASEREEDLLLFEVLQRAEVDRVSRQAAKAAVEAAAKAAVEAAAEATAKATAKALVEGRVEGSRELLKRLCLHKFGALPEAAELRLSHASEAEILAWADSVLTATDLDALFRSV